VAEAPRETDSELTLAYVGRASGPESQLVPQAGIDFVGLHLGSLGPSAFGARPRLAGRLAVAFGQATRLVSRFRPDVVLATGGYVCVPVSMAARQRRIPVLMLEQNALPGRAVRWLGSWVRDVATSFPGTAAYLPRARVVCTGNPVRRPFAELAGRSTAVIYTVGLFDLNDPDQNPGMLHRLAQATGGEAFLPGQLDEVVDICERIAREIRNQYTIGYVPATPVRNGAHRTIRVVARAVGRGRLFVRTRTGYIAGGEGAAKNGVPK